MVSSNRPFLALALLMGVALGACTDAGGDDLDEYLCQQADVGDDFQELTRGNFSPRDLADLGPDADARERGFQEAGMERGRFVFYKQSLPKPPFEPPVNVVCQVLEFSDPLAASQWVLDLSEDDIREGILVAWLPGELSTAASDLTAPDSQAESSRAYRVQGQSTAGTTHADVLIRARGNVVSLVAAGRTAEGLPEPESTEGAAIQQAVFERLSRDGSPP